MNKKSDWYNRMLKKFGTDEAISAHMREQQAKSRKNYNGSGGFRSLDPERLKEISREAARKRWQNDSPTP